MMNFESDLAAPDQITDLPTGTPDMLDSWFEEQWTEAFAEWSELTFDPDCDPPF